MFSHLRSKLIALAFCVYAIAVTAPLAVAADKLKVVATFSILGDFVTRVGGERIELFTLVGPDGDAHVYEPNPQDAKNVGAARLVFINGIEFEGWIERLIETSGYQGSVIKTTQGITLENMAGEEVGAPSQFDPHAWQSALNAQTYVKNISAALCTADADGCQAYQSNAAAYITELQNLDAGLKAAFDKIPAERRSVITSHDAFGYYANQYGVKFLAPEGVSTESEASAKDVAKMIEQINESKASALFVENVSDQRLIEQIARETGLKIGGALYSDALSANDGPAATYIDLMKHNTKLLTDAMVAR